MKYISLSRVSNVTYILVFCSKYLTKWLRLLSCVLYLLLQTDEDIHYPSVKMKTYAGGTRGQFIRTLDVMNSKSEQSFASTKTLDVSTISSDDFDSLYKQEEAENNVVIIFHSCTVYTGIESILLLFDLIIFFPNH